MKTYVSPTTGKRAQNANASAVSSRAVAQQAPIQQVVSGSYQQIANNSAYSKLAARWQGMADSRPVQRKISFGKLGDDYAFIMGISIRHVFQKHLYALTLFDPKAPAIVACALEPYTMPSVIEGMMKEEKHYGDYNLDEFTGVLGLMLLLKRKLNWERFDKEKSDKEGETPVAGQIGDFIMKCPPGDLQEDIKHYGSPAAAYKAYEEHVKRFENGRIVQDMGGGYMSETWTRDKKAGAVRDFGPADEHEHRHYRMWTKITGRGLALEMGDKEHKKKFDELQALLKYADIKLIKQLYQGVGGPHAELVKKLIPILPLKTLKEKGALKSIKIGGAHPELGYFQGSAYDDKALQLHIMDCILTQPKDVFLRTVCHELGHAFFEPYLMCTQQYELLQGQFDILRDTGFIFAKDQGAFTGSKQSRFSYQSGSFSEFCAETFMHFIFDNADLQAFIAAASQHHDRRIAVAWKNIYQALVAALGKEYDSGDVWKKLLGL